MPPSRNSFNPGRFGAPIQPQSTYRRSERLARRSRHGHTTPQMSGVDITTLETQQMVLDGYEKHVTVVTPDVISRFPGTPQYDLLNPASMRADPGVHGAPVTSQGTFPDELDIHSVPPECKWEGTDWCAVFNPKVERMLDVQLVHTLIHDSVVCCVRFSSDGKYLATGCNRTVQIYDTRTGAKICVLKDKTVEKIGDLYIRSVCFSPDGKLLATSAENEQIRIWDISKKQILRVFDGHQDEVYSVDFSLDGGLIVSGSGDKTVRIWEMANGDMPPKVLTINDPGPFSDGGVVSVAISPNGQFVAAGSLDTAVHIWDVASGHLVERLRGHRDSVYSVAFTPDGKGLVRSSMTARPRLLVFPSSPVFHQDARQRTRIEREKLLKKKM